MNYKKRIAIYTIVNKQDIFDEFKLNIYEQKGIDYQLYKISNCKGEYNSARKAYNDNATDNNVDYYVFLHPDIRFIDKNALADIMKSIDSIGDFGVVGIAGAREVGNTREIISTIVQGEQKRRVGTFIDRPTQVQTVDECLFVIKRDYFVENKFSEKDGWHLYSVEYSLKALKDGKENFVVPARVWHMSPGSSLDEKYMSQLEIILQEYKRDYYIICTTVKAWQTKGLTAYVFRKYYWIKQRIKKTIMNWNLADKRGNRQNGSET